jgi:hypothetical protein
MHSAGTTLGMSSLLPTTYRTYLLVPGSTSCKPPLSSPQNFYPSFWMVMISASQEAVPPPPDASSLSLPSALLFSDPFFHPAPFSKIMKIPRLTDPLFPRVGLTCIQSEGPWDRVHQVIGQAHTILHQQGIVRIQTDIRVGSRSVHAIFRASESYLFHAPQRTFSSLHVVRCI